MSFLPYFYMHYKFFKCLYLHWSNLKKSRVVTKTFLHEPSTQSFCFANISTKPHKNKTKKKGKYSRKETREEETNIYLLDYYRHKVFYQTSILIMCNIVCLCTLLLFHIEDSDCYILFVHISR